MSFDAGSIFLYLVPACDAKIDTALANKDRDIGGRQEYQCNREVLDEGDVETVFATELDVGTFKEIQGGRIEATLWAKQVSIVSEAS